MDLDHLNADRTGWWSFAGEKPDQFRPLRKSFNAYEKYYKDEFPEDLPILQPGDHVVLADRWEQGNKYRKIFACCSLEEIVFEDEEQEEEYEEELVEEESEFKEMVDIDFIPDFEVGSVGIRDDSIY